MVSDVPLGVFLSGGIDSPLIAALAQAQAAQQLDAFTVHGESLELDESADAKMFAEKIGVRHFLRHGDATEVEALVQQNTAAFSEPFADHSSIPTLLVSEVARERLTVALSGDGGDELFFGYPRFRKVLGTHRLFGLPRKARVARYAAGRLGVLGPVPAGVRFDNIGSWYLNSHAYWQASDLAACAPSLSALPKDFELYSAPPSMTVDKQADWLRQNELMGHLQRVLLKVDRASMHHSLEVRVPLLDLEVVEFAMRVAPNACMTDKHDKAILRALLARQVSSFVDGPKRGFTLPVGEWLRGPLRPLVHDLLLTGDPHPVGLFEKSGLLRMYNDHLSGIDRTLPLWAALSLQLWWGHHYRTSS
jgi:asparagine synthase (glutamine-hydrolysing)